MKGIGFEAVPLALVLPEVAGSELRRVAEAAQAIDQARTDEPLWFWEHGSAFSMDVFERHPNGDWFDVELEVENRLEGLRRVEATLNVVCWCEVDHQSHNVGQVRYVCDDGASMADGLEQAAKQVVAWLRDTHDPSVWRGRAGLPSPEAR